MGWKTTFIDRDKKNDKIYEEVNKRISEERRKRGKPKGKEVKPISEFYDLQKYLKQKTS